MKKADIVAKINSFSIDGVSLEENTEITNPQLELMLKGAESSKELDELRAENDSLKSAVQESEEIISDLNDKIEEMSTGQKLKKPVFKKGGKTYLVTAPKFNFEGKVFTIEDLKGDTDKIFTRLSKFPGQTVFTEINED